MPLTQANPDTPRKWASIIKGHIHTDTQIFRPKKHRKWLFFCGGEFSFVCRCTAGLASLGR